MTQIFVVMHAGHCEQTLSSNPPPDIGNIKMSGLEEDKKKFFLGAVDPSDLADVIIMISNLTLTLVCGVVRLACGVVRLLTP